MGWIQVKLAIKHTEEITYLKEKTGLPYTGISDYNVLEQIRVCHHC